MKRKCITMNIDSEKEFKASLRKIGDQIRNCYLSNIAQRCQNEGAGSARKPDADDSDETSPGSDDRIVGKRKRRTTVRDNPKKSTSSVATRSRMKRNPGKQKQSTNGGSTTSGLKLEKTQKTRIIKQTELPGSNSSVEDLEQTETIDLYGDEYDHLYSVSNRRLTFSQLCESDEEDDGEERFKRLVKDQHLRRRIIFPNLHLWLESSGNLYTN